MKTLLPILLASSATVVFLTGIREPLPDAGIDPVRLVRTLELDGVGVSRPAALAFSHRQGALLVLHARDESTTSGV